MGRTFKTIVSLDGYPRLSQDGSVTHTLVGYEFVVPTKGPLHSRVPGLSSCTSLVRKNTHGAGVLLLHPKNEKNIDLEQKFIDLEQKISIWNKN